MAERPNMTDVPETTSEPVVRRRQQRLNSLIALVATFLALVVVLLMTDNSNGRSTSRAIEMPSVDGGASFWSTAPAPDPPAKQSSSSKPISGAKPVTGGFVAQPGRNTQAHPAQRKAPILFAGVPGISTTLPGENSSSKGSSSAHPANGPASGAILTGAKKHVTVPAKLPQVKLPGVKQVTTGLKHVTTGLKHVTTGLKHVTTGLKHVTTGLKHVTTGLKHVTTGLKHVTTGLKHVITIGTLAHHSLPGQNRHLLPSGHRHPSPHALLHTPTLIKPSTHHWHHHSSHYSSHHSYHFDWSSFAEQWWSRFGWHHH